MMKKSSIIAIGLSTLLVVCNAPPMNSHVENKKAAAISQKEVSKKKTKKKDVSKDETNEIVNDTTKQEIEENTIQEDQESIKNNVQTQEKTSNQNTNENKTQKKVETKQTPVQPVESNQPSVKPSQPASSGNTTNAQQPQKEEQTKILRVTYWVKCDCGKELTHSIDYKDYESYYSSNDYSVKTLINQLLDEGHCAGNEEVCGASHYRYGTNENWIKS